VQKLAISREAGRRVEGLLLRFSKHPSTCTLDEEKEEALQLHLQRFGEVGRLFAAPARVKLIGEQTDCTGGLVMPMAIGFRAVAVLSQRTDNRATFYSTSPGRRSPPRCSIAERRVQGLALVSVQKTCTSTTNQH
jgi:hypothetical protein